MILLFVIRSYCYFKSFDVISVFEMHEEPGVIA